MAVSTLIKRAVPVRRLHIAGLESFGHLHGYQQAPRYTTLPRSNTPRVQTIPFQRTNSTPPAFRRVPLAPKMPAQDGQLVWIDCEMTGLDPDQEEIIEIFCLITNKNLDLLDEGGWGTVVHQPKSRMDQMDEWCTRTHGQSGLTAKVIASSVTPEQAAEGLLAYVKRYVPETRAALLAGNSVHADKSFLIKGPYRKVMDHLHYRILDVSAIKEAAASWCPEVMARAPRKKGLHQAKNDILESIAEARYYKEAIFQAGGRDRLASS